MYTIIETPTFKNDADTISAMSSLVVVDVEKSGGLSAVQGNEVVFE